MEQIPTFSVVEVKKHEMLSPVLGNESITFDEAVAVNDTTAALIEKAIQYYSAQDKEVVLLGHSWGATILGEYLDDYGNDQVHKIVPMEGRLSVQPEFVDFLLDGYVPEFNGTEVDISQSEQNAVFQSILTLSAAGFYNRYTDSLATLDLSNMMYSYAEFDVSTGPLLPIEIDFLNQSGAQTLFIPDGYHGSSYDSEIQDIILAFIRDDLFFDVDECFDTKEKLHLFPTIAQSSIQIESDHGGTIQIYDMMGRPVFEKGDAQFPLNVDVSNLANGQYVAVLQNKSNRLSTARFQVVIK